MRLPKLYNLAMETIIMLSLSFLLPAWALQTLAWCLVGCVLPYGVALALVILAHFTYVSLTDG